MARLETQVVRFRTASETAERAEEELKTERRKLQREVRAHLKMAVAQAFVKRSRDLETFKLAITSLGTKIKVLLIKVQH